MSAGSVGTEGVPWSRFRDEAEDLAARVEDRFAANLHHVIGTIRADGTPRLSGTEVAIAEGEVTIGMMSGSRKLADVQRDRRIEIHSAPLEDDLAQGDAKLAGLLTGATRIAQPAEGVSFRLAITRASLLRVDGNELLFTVWEPGEEVRSIRRR